MTVAVQKIPEILVYEMVDGVPIYYKDYQLYLQGNKQLEELIGSSYLQGALVTHLVILLSQLLDLDAFRIISNEVVLKFNKKSWRAADLAVFKKSLLKGIPLNNKYLEVPPEIVIEIDTKAALDEIKKPLSYYQEKTDQLLAFGVNSVIWIFTDTQKVMIAQQNKDWHITNWGNDVEIAPNVKINIARIIEELEV